MHSLTFTIKTLSPVVLSRQSGDRVLTETKNYFSGSVIRGILATQYIRQHDLKKNAHQDKKFQRWFLSGQLRFLPSYPMTINEDKQLHSVPAPRCLYQDKDGKEVVNLAEEQRKEEAKGYKAMGGFVTLTAEADQVQLYKLETKKRIRFHLVRNTTEARIAGASKENGVFNYEALDEGQVFAGSIIGSQQEILAFQKAFANKLTVNIGRSKHVQYGECLLTFGKVEKIDTTEVSTTIAKDEWVQLVCHTPLLLTNELGVIEPSANLLQKYLERLLGSEVSIPEAFVTIEKIEQFVGIWGMKRPCVRAIAAGSVFCVRATEGWSKELRAQLTHLIYTGIGCRRAEGYGQLRILKTPKKGYTITEVAKKKQNKPTGPVPILLKEMLTGMVQDKLQYHVRSQAVGDANQYLRSSHDKEVGTALASKLEGTLNEAKNAQEFMSLVADYHPETTKRLRRLRGDQGSLYKFLTTNEKPYKINEFKDSALGSLATEVAWQLHDDFVFQEQLFRDYWQSFFRHMRKGLKAMGKGGAIDE